MLAGDEAAMASAASELLAWYERERRDLPWRRRSDPYAIWVSEIMLQQTQVETVLGYYEGFLSRFPDVAALAAAAEQEVVAAWSGLGYYRRARALHAAAREVARSGEWPRSAAEWRRLPGVGDYTAAAISSIALGEEIAVLDGNVERVVSRLLASAADPKRAATRRPLHEAARRLLVPGRAGDSNQALMELGATVCRPQAPRCSACPLSRCCAGLTSGDPERFPAPRRRRASELVKRRVFVVATGERWLLFQRPADAEPLAGFWELPWVEGSAGGAELERKYGGDWEIEESCGRVRHAITHRRFEVDVHGARWRPPGVPEATSTNWFTAEDLERLAVSSLVLKALRRWARRSSA